MSDFYCDEVLSGNTPVERVFETEAVLAFHHTRPSYPSHVVVIPKRHIDSLVALSSADDMLLLEMLAVVRQVAERVLGRHAACRVITNLGTYQDSAHLHWHVVSGAKQPPMPLPIARLLPDIASVLGARAVRWALGASAMLCLRGFAVTPRDIDLVVDERDIAAADEALRSLGTKAPPRPSGHYGTRFFHQYRAHGVDVDMMAGLAIRTDAGEIDYPFPAQCDTVAVGGECVPLCPLEDWYALYLLMAREQKVQMIEARFAKEPPNTGLLRKWAARPLPEIVARRMNIT